MIFFCERTNLGSSIGLDDSKDKKLTNTINHALTCGMYSCQICLGPMKSYTRSKIEQKDIEETKKIQKQYGINIFSHMPYLYNLCGSSKQIAWGIGKEESKEQNNKTKAMIKSMEYELKVLSNFNNDKYTSGCVVHPGNLYNSHKDDKILEKGIEAIAQTINKINFPEKSMLLLENSAGEKNKIAKNIDELAKIYELVKCKENVGICIDTAHLWGGNYNMSKVEHIDNFFKEFDHKIGLDKLKLIHLNDSKVKLGSGVDRHEYICRGNIWKKDPSILSYFLDKTRNIPTVLETCEEDYFVIQCL